MAQQRDVKEENEDANTWHKLNAHAQQRRRGQYTPEDRVMGLQEGALENPNSLLSWESSAAGLWSPECRDQV